MAQRHVPCRLAVAIAAGIDDNRRHRADSHNGQPRVQRLVCAVRLNNVFALYPTREHDD